MHRRSVMVPAAGLLIAACITAGTGQATAAGTTTTATTTTTAGALVPASDTQVTFVVDGTATYGTLHVPAHHAGRKLPAALLLPGSGPTDRDGDQPPRFTPHTLALFADVLGGDEVMTLRFDKYFTGQTGGGRFAGDPARYDLHAQVRQIDAAYALLARRPEADRRRLLIVGHSEGGLTAMLAAESVAPRPAGLALFAPQDLRLLDLLRLQLVQQLDRAVAAGQLSAAIAQQNVQGIDRAIAEFRAGRPVDTTGLLPGIANLLASILGPTNGNFVRSDDEVYPPAVAAHLPSDIRVLLTCGTADTQVPCSTTAPLATALRQAHTRHPGLTRLVDVDHDLHPAGVPANDQILAPAVIDALNSFAKKCDLSKEDGDEETLHGFTAFF